ncbi:MAG: hypothetical protein KA164_05455 [Rhodoferax sp.]|nr:hypothetical protein [Rhodoferax sp.]
MLLTEFEFVLAMVMHSLPNIGVGPQSRQVAPFTARWQADRSRATVLMPCQQGQGRALEVERGSLGHDQQKLESFWLNHLDLLFSRV